MVRISDIKLIKLLMENSRISYVELARALGVTEAAVRKKIKKLEKLGVVRKYSIEVDPRKLGYEVVAFIGLDAAPEHYIRVMEGLREREEVVSLYSTSGDHMLIAECWFRNSSELSGFVDELGKMEGVSRVCPAIVVEKVK
ncbi:MAG: Lrp/AsnC family transcriptional regulator [Nitrososphaeria archaeon]|nr:Lrp/AsnC family transcriptional regulator [Aigarchaeota archaeon]MCX8187814.1 Lrp/AsnC family transcriptional regulator [Nitrososphaeria archaeon]MDW8022047.1 Lrp/AsnC family transcriptional regulator [Nitrososphaerota archaeon]